MKCKAQMGIMEYVIMLFLLIIIILAMVFFFSFWQATQMSLEKGKIERTAVLSLMENILSSPDFARKKSMLDDAKLTAALGKEKALAPVFGKDLFIIVKVIGKEDVVCKSNDYDNTCGYWEIGEKKTGKKFSTPSYIVPVNIYRVMYDGTTSKTEIGTLEVGINYAR